jgi:hypothetical protein
MSNRHLPTVLRGALSKAVRDARVVAEDGVRDAIRRLGIADGKPPAYLSNAEKEYRRRLRAHARALGDAFNRSTDTQETRRLIEAAAYAHWHRMLFARFLAERGLLRHPEHNVPVSLEDCRELAEAEGLSDSWAVAERYAAAMLPAVFRTDDPVMSLDLDPVHTQKLHQLVTGLSSDIFHAEDSLGWTYQFWRVAEKQSIDELGQKIGAVELPAVTQLFTESYMVRFLLHNTLGAWWAGKVLAKDPTLASTAANEGALRSACALNGYDFNMLRFVQDSEDGRWRPATGTFQGWPMNAKDITMLDPCCGSGHFLTEALRILTALRQAEEGMLPADAVAAVLRDNLNGLEIDGRCVQIAAFAVALTAWRIGGWQILPLPHIAWIGAPPPLPKKDFVGLADGDPELEYAFTALHDLFSQAPLLGSLMDPSSDDLFEVEKMREISRLLEPLLAKTKRSEPERAEGVISARGMADAALALHRRYVLQATNVPFLGKAKQHDALAAYIARRFGRAKADLATAMMAKMLAQSAPAGTVAVVSPQNWYFQKSYIEFRQAVLNDCTLHAVCDLGPAAFFEMNWWAARTALTILSRGTPPEDWSCFAFTARNHRDTAEKPELLLGNDVTYLKQSEQNANPDSRIATERIVHGTLLAEFANAYQGVATADFDRFGRAFWEVNLKGNKWSFQFGTVKETVPFGGRKNVVLWEGGKGALANSPQARIQGLAALGKMGVAVSQMRHLPATLYDGEFFDNNCSAIVVNDPIYLPAIWCYCSSEEYKNEIRKVNPKVSVTNATLTKVPFDVAYWRAFAEKEYPSGLPKPFSTDPTQWIFHGHPAKAAKGTALHVALARLCGYRWPAETDHQMRLSDEAFEWISKVAILPEGDKDGMLGVPAVAGERSLADRLRGYLAASFGEPWLDALERRLVSEADEVIDGKTDRDSSIDAWIRDRAFRQHCMLFWQRPFLWHITDGLKGGFSVFVHYQSFDLAALRKLTYTMLGDWLARAKAENNALRYEKGRELQQILEKVLEGEKPYDIFVRWKPLAQQPLGWDPDLNDGVRQNIRPFIVAGVLTHDLSKILKGKDRGDDLPSAPWYPVFKGERRNDFHTTLPEKRAARETETKRMVATK